MLTWNLLLSVHAIGGCLLGKVDQLVPVAAHDSSAYVLRFTFYVFSTQILPNESGMSVSWG